MKSTLLTMTILTLIIGFSYSPTATAQTPPPQQQPQQVQQRPAQTQPQQQQRPAQPVQQVQPQYQYPYQAPPPLPAKPQINGATKFRFYATYDYNMTTPTALNDNRRVFLWNNTTAAQGTFDNMMGFTGGAGYFLDMVSIGSGYIGLEYSQGSQELGNTSILLTSSSVQDSFNYQTVYAVYDMLFNHNANTFEIGVGVGQAFQYQYHNMLRSGSTQEDVLWEDTPFVFKARANYTYHITELVRLRGGIQYEYMTSSNMKSSAAHPTVSINGLPVASGQTLRTTGGQDQAVDMSGIRLNAGVVVAF